MILLNFKLIVCICDYLLGFSSSFIYFSYEYVFNKFLFLLLPLSFLQCNYTDWQVFWVKVSKKAFVLLVIYNTDI